MKQELRSAIRLILATQHLAMLGGTMALTLSVNIAAAELPVVCASGNCGVGGPTSWVSSGGATATQTQNTLTINQSSDRAVLNWASFNVSADGRVVFNQPAATSIALNRIYQDSPSRIFGAVEANGQVYLVNPNGFVFGRTAKINAAGILASTLSISDATFASGLLAPELIQRSEAALASDGRVNVLDSNNQLVLDENGEPIEVKLVVEEGAVLQSRGSGGRVLLASREIDNAGTISAPDGQAILAAGDRVYLQASTDPSLRGLLVEVAAGGEAWNRMTGNISAARGNVTVAGLAVNQSGRISASTTVAANGSVRLLARDNPAFIPNSNGSTTLGAGQNGGRLDIGPSSRIDILPELSDAATAVDDQLQMASKIEMSAREVFMRSGSQIVAPAGELRVTAAANPFAPTVNDPSARIRVESGAQIDLSGSDVTLPMSRNQVTVELRANELRDSPAQRNGALRGQTVVIDARIGTPLADVSGALAAIPKDIAERTSHGGTSVFNSSGDIVIAAGARFDVSGGVTSFLEGPLATSQLIGSDGRIYDIGEADPSRTYVGILNPMFRRADDRWGFVETAVSPGISRIEPGYLAGSDAGTVQFAAPSMVMNGSLRADTVVGPYQRLPGQQPLGGQLIIGIPDPEGQLTPDYRAPSVSFSQQGASIVVGDTASLPAQQPLLLPVDYLSRGFTRTAVYSNGRITVPENTPLNLSAGSSLNLTGHQVNILANVTSTGGTIKATSGLTTGTGETPGRAGVAVGDNVVLDVQGNWTNDALSALTDPFGRPSTSVLANGGSIALALRAEDAELVIGDQVQLLANAGAWLQRDGTLRGGDGGSIAIDAGGYRGALELGETVTVQAFGVLGGEGGAFALTAPRIEVGSGTSWHQAQRLDPLELQLEYLSIGSSLFTDHGFGSVSLVAEGTVDPEVDGDGLRIASGTQIQARASVLQMSDASVDAAGARNIAGISSVMLPGESARQAMALTFAVDPTGQRHPDRVGSLNIAAGSSIAADAGSSVVFSSIGAIDVDGTIRARGGSIAMTLENPSGENDVGYLPALGLHIGANAVLDVSGTAIYQPVGDGLLSGTIYDGGTVNLQANRGFVIVDRGALIDVSGTSAALDRNVSESQGATRSIIGSNAGTLSLIAPEAIAFNGTLRAHAGVGDTGASTGGELVMRLSRNRGHSGGVNALLPTYPNNSRVLRVTDEDLVLGGPAPPSGFAVLQRHTIEDSGIDALTLESEGRIEFDATSLSLNRRIVLDSPEIMARNGAAVSLSAPYLALGNSVANRAPLNPTPATGTGSFNFQGQFIEAIGAVTLSGATTTTLASSGDLRLRESQNGATRSGHLQAAGDLTLQATQIYPSTFTSYALSALGDAATLRIESSGAPTSTPLTAGGRLTLNAANIEQHGVLRAPFGSIDFNAGDSLTLGAGSATSVSGAGSLIPFGRVENGEWIYVTDARAVQAAIPERHIGINAPSIEQDENATLDLRGGGDLYAYEWIPGTGGSADALAADAAAGRYAILPSQRGEFAPYDPQEMQTSGLEVGDSVYLSGIPGLEPGFYALLPARYALLPGAMLIESVADTTDIQPGSIASLADGTPVVAGYRTFGTTGLGGSRFTGFAIRSADQARQLASYQDTLASTFYADRAARLELPRPMLPSDAGTLSLLATTSLDMQGIVNVAAAEGGRAGRVEVAATNLEVVTATSASADTVQIAASVLNSWRPGELWIGGTRRGGTVDVVADRVRIAEGANITAGEVMLIANDSIEVAAGATVASTSGAQGTAVARASLSEVDLALANDDAGAAVLSVSDRSVFNVARAAGDIEVGSITAASGSVLSTGGTLLANAPDSVALSGDIRANGAVWQLGSSTVRFDEAAHQDGLNINSALLARMQAAASLTVASSDAIEFSYAVNLGTTNPLDDLTLRAGSLRNLSGGDINFAADRVTLAGTAATPATDPVAGEGVLSIAANAIELDRGNLSLDGFSRTSLRAANDIIGVGDTHLRVGGDLDLAAARVTASSGGHTFIDADQGTVRISSTGAASNSIGGVLGGALSIAATNIEHDGTLFLPSGLVTLAATSNLSVGSTGVIDVSGRLVTAADRIVGSSGGTVRMASGGNLVAASGSLIDVSGASAADAGRLSMHATGDASLFGDLRGVGGSASATGGAFDIYAGSLTDASALVTQLQNGGFTEKQSLHVGSGDLNLAAGQTVTARAIEWTTDRGQIQIDGIMRAPSAAQRSAIRLYGSDVTIGSTAQLNADANAGVQFGGDIELGSSTGSINVAAGSLISARGDEAKFNGSLRLRAAATADDVAITALAGTIQIGGDIVVESVRAFDVPAATTTVEYGAIRTDVDAYMATAGANIRNRLDTTSALGLRVEAGVELRHDGDLSLDALDLATWRYDGSPVALTVRSTGSINVNGTISDGFGIVGLRTTLTEGNSSTLRFAAGANLASANPNAVVRGAAGDINLAGGAFIRTGTGDVRVTAARDVIFGTGSSIYTGGIASAPTENVATPAGASFAFPDLGGNVSIVAGNDVVGASVSQSVTEWQRRQGSATPPRRTQWGIDLRRFGWDAGTLGGGDLSIVAGNDVTSIAATAADSAVELQDNVLTRFGGGSLSVSAGGDVNSAMLYVARGEGKVTADGALGSSRLGESGESLGSLLMLGDARATIAARGGIDLETILNPTALRQPGIAIQSMFFTYGDDSGVDVRSTGGDVTLNAASANRLRSYLGAAVTDANQGGGILSVLPSSLSLMSLTRDVGLTGGLILFPSNSGQLDVFAARDFTASPGATMIMSDIDANEIATPLRPAPSLNLLGWTIPSSASASGRHIADDQPVLITAGRDIVGHDLSVAKSARMTAGRDIVDTSLRAQNLRDGDVTSVAAGRDIRYAPTLLTGQMTVGGPGRFDVLTGRNLDLGFSAGLTTTGRLANPAIQSERGADLNVLVGMGRDLDAVAFVDNIIAESAELRDSLLQFMVARTGNASLTYQQAATGFKALDATAQRPLLLDLFYGQLVASGRETINDPTLDYQRGYRAIDALFPGSRAEEGTTNPFAGDLTLAFSRIYTLAGGDVSITVPGGLVNVGLANPPASVQQRPASELGIVAQRAGNVRIFTSDDVLVNQSRVFTLLGGNISIWSTLGNIDAGRGSKSSVSAPPPTVLVDPTGRVTLDFAGAVAGSGIRTIATDDGVKPGDVDLTAPAGVIDAGDAGIGGGDGYFAAPQIVGIDNIDIGGVSAGLPPETSGLGASLAGVSAAASSSASASTSAVDENDESDEAQASLAQTALSWLEVFVVGLGEENCKQDDVDCLKRQPVN